MCEPATIASVAAMAAGTFLQSRAQDDAIKSRASAINSEIARQEAFERDARALHAQNVADFSPEQGVASEVEDRGAEIGEKLVAAQGDLSKAPAGSLFLRSAPRVVGDHEASKLDEGREFTNQQGLALGKLNSLADLIFDNNLRATERNGEIDGLNSSARGSLGVLGSEINAANSKASSGLGDVLVGVGSTALGAGGNLFGGGAQGSALKAPRTVAAAPTSLAPQTSLLY